MDKGIGAGEWTCGFCVVANRISSFPFYAISSDRVMGEDWMDVGRTLYFRFSHATVDRAIEPFIHPSE